MEKTMRLEKLLKRFSKVKILVIGDIMLDRFLWGKVSRISPEAPVPVVMVEKEDFLLGGAANVVNNVHSLGGKVLLCGVVGDDEMGQKILKKLTEMGMKLHGVFIEEGRQTTVKTRIIAHQQQLVRIDRETTDHPKVSTRQHLSNFLAKGILDFDGVIISDYGKGLLTKKLTQTVVHRAKRLKKFVMVDPKPQNFSFYRGATVVTPNIKEASEASGIPIMDRSSLKRAGDILFDRLKCEFLVITRGEEGMTILKSNREPFDVSTIAKDVYDVTGAGDTVIGTMALAWGAGATIREAAELANYAAGIVVGKMGTATVSQEELMNVIKERPRTK